MQVTTSSPVFNTRTLPAIVRNQIAHTELPGLYLKAVDAIKACARIDELRDIQDKHSAIAHYAKELRDNQLRYYADRVYLRAFTRIGELLLKIPEFMNKPYKQRVAIAESFGLTYNRAHNAVMAAHLPRSKRQELIEAEPPVGQRELTVQGRDIYHKSTGYDGRPLKPESEAARLRRQTKWEADEAVRKLERPREYAEDILRVVADAIEEITQLQTVDGKFYNLAALARLIDKADARTYRKDLVRLSEMLDELDQHLPKAK